MGKGDRKTKRGKLFSKTYGNSRPRKATTTAAPAATSDAKEETK